MVKAAKVISEKNTKSEILQAYEELMGQLGVESAESKEEIEAEKVVEKVSSETTEKIINDLAKVKISLNQAIDSLSSSLTSEAQKLVEIRKAVNISQKELETTFQIKSRAEVLKKLFEAYSQKQAELEKEFVQKRQNSEEQQNNYETDLKRKRQRDEEEYKYQLELERERWTQKLDEEKESYRQKLTELEELKKQVGEFPQEKEKEVSEAVAKALAEAKRQFEVEKSFTKQETDSVLKITQLKISQLEETVKTQSNEIIQLKRQLKEATKQVKDIAVAVIESKKPEEKQFLKQPSSNS